MSGWSEERLARIQELCTLPNPHQHTRYLSLGRMFALNAIKETVSPIAHLPQWAGKKGMVAIRITGITLNDIIPSSECFNARFADQHEIVKKAVFSLLNSKMPPLHLVQDGRLTENGVLVRDELRVDFNFQQSKYISITAILPSLDCTGDLLLGSLQLTPGSYATLCPSGAFAEVCLSRLDRTVLETIINSLNVSQQQFRLMLTESLSQCFGCFTQVRYSTCCAQDSRTHEGLIRENSQQKKGSRLQHFDPASTLSEIVVGIELPFLLEGCRDREQIILPLGCASDFPVAIGILPPFVPTACLRALLAAQAIEGQAPLRAVPVNVAPVPDLRFPYLVVGPFSRDWLTKQNPSRDPVSETQLKQTICRVVSSHDSVTDARFIGKSVPHCLLITATDATAGGALVRELSSSLPILATCCGDKQLEFVFETGAPRECIQLLGEREMKDAINAFKSVAADRDNPPAAPDARQ
jgi:hypothetical protein